MPITVSCPCQNTYRVKDELAGKKIRCPHCKEPVQVPLAAQSAQVPVTVTQQPAYEEEQNDDYPMQDSPGFGDASGQGGFNSAANQDLQPTPYSNGSAGLQGTPQAGYQDQTYQQPKRGVNVGSVLAGLGMMVGAVIWFFGALIFANTVFIYPPILFIFGLIAFVKGLLGAE